LPSITSKEEYKQGRPVLPDTPDYINGKDTADGFICGTCIETNKRKAEIKLLGPYHKKTHQYVIEEQKRVNRWNDTANNVNNTLKTITKVRIFMKPIKNRYQDEINHWSILHHGIKNPILIKENKDDRKKIQTKRIGYLGKG
jgi:hypothetical protein